MSIAPDRAHGRGEDAARAGFRAVRHPHRPVVAEGQDDWQAAACRDRGRASVRAAAGTSAMQTAMRPTGARCWRGSRPRACCLAGRSTARWGYDPELLTEVELTFAATDRRRHAGHARASQSGALRRRCSEPCRAHQSRLADPPRVILRNTPPTTRNAGDRHVRVHRSQRSWQPVRARRIGHTGREAARLTGCRRSRRLRLAYPSIWRGIRSAACRCSSLTVSCCTRRRPSCVISIGCFLAWP